MLFRSTRDECRRAIQDARLRPAGLTRARTGDSMAVQGNQSSSDEDEDEEMDDAKS